MTNSEKEAHSLALLIELGIKLGYRTDDAGITSVSWYRDKHFVNAWFDGDELCLNDGYAHHPDTVNRRLGQSVFDLKDPSSFEDITKWLLIGYNGRIAQAAMVSKFGL